MFFAVVSIENFVCINKHFGSGNKQKETNLNDEKRNTNAVCECGENGFDDNG